MPVQTKRFEGKVAIVTGASRGIGLAIAQRLVDEGANVIITARGQEALDAAVAQLGDAALARAGKAQDKEHQEDVVRTALDTWGRLDVLVNNTGINPVFGGLMDLDDSAATKISEVNLLATLSWTRTAWNLWMKENGGSVVNLASIAGLRTAPGIAYYGVTKAGLIHLTEELAVELGPTVRVNAVAPAVVKTDFAKALYEGREDEVAKPYPLKRLGRPEDIAGPVAFLASEDAAWVTGQTLPIDGGITLTGGF
ncbi:MULTISPECIES: SDR family oxidoreductase [Dermacoccus]|jgi:3-oxoacyl-[acyl-carrier protein] reductase|uniref:SDR family oxidoreductase n=1 Tax=Dermacoccus TaxID=57495 RepID=UPI001879D36B|nr:MULTISPECIES: SDR family oxidoreductase [Dermacoccus]MBE7370229.1 SDR family oxidoreductase [Dermacoccus barathri]MBZ4496907.1 SDR family oxidoreductase [Dermacoccus sp. Tok2021]